MVRAKLVVLSFVVVLALAVSGIAIAVLSVGSAEIEASATVAEVDLSFRTGDTLPGSPNNSVITGTCLGPPGPPCTDPGHFNSLSGGVLTVFFDNVWKGRTFRIGAAVPGEDYIWLVNTGEFPVEVTGPTFGGAGFGDPGSGEPIEVKLIDPSDTDLIYPFTINANDGVPVRVFMAVNESAATPGASYGPVTISINGQ